MLDTGSPVTIFALDKLKAILKKNALLVRPMIEKEKYVDFNRQPIKLLGYIFGIIKANGKTITKARILVSQAGTKCIVGRDWLRALKVELTDFTVNENESKSINTIINTNKRELIDSLHNDFYNLFNRTGRIRDYCVKSKIFRQLQNNSTKRKENSHSAPTFSRRGNSKLVKRRAY